MRTTKISMATLSLIAFVLLFPSLVLNAQKSPPSRTQTKEVKVYFVYENSEGPLVSGNLYALTRQVSKIAPLQGALEALVADPTEEEAKQGYNSAAYTAGMKLASARIKRRIAYAYFTRPAIEGSAPDLASLKFEEAVTRTARQFPTVKKVVVCVNGQMEFGIGLVEDAPKPCPREVD